MADGYLCYFWSLKFTEFVHLNPGNGIYPRDIGIISLPLWLSLKINYTGRREHPPSVVICRVTFRLISFLASQRN